MAKKILSITIPEELVSQIDEQVKETGAKSRSAFITQLIQQRFTDYIIVLSKEEFDALNIFEGMMTPEEVIRQVVRRMVEVGQEVRKRRRLNVS